MRTLGGSVAPRSVFAGNVKMKGLDCPTGCSFLPCLVLNCQKAQLKDVVTW